MQKPGYSQVFQMRNGKWRALHLAHGASREEALENLATFVGRALPETVGVNVYERDEVLQHAWRRLRELASTLRNADLTAALRDFHDALVTARPAPRGGYHRRSTA